MKRITCTAFSVALLAAVGFGAVANTQGPPPTPSANLGIEVDLKPVAGSPGQFFVTSTITDLESNAVIARPALRIDAGKTAAIQLGNEGKWAIRISVSADNATRKASYDATFTREGKAVSRQQVSVSLDS